MNQFSSLFEVLATINLAYVGVESIREVIINILTEFYVPEDLEEAEKRINDKFATVNDGLAGGTFGAGLEGHAKRIKTKFDLEQDKLKETHGLFMKRKGFKPIFFAAFLFCFSNLILIGYEEFFITYSSTTAEQWFLLYFVYMIVLFYEYPQRLFNLLSRHNTLFCVFFVLLGFGFGYSLCPYKLPGFSYLREFVMTFSLIVGITPFVLEYFEVRKYAKNRAITLKSITEKAETDLDGILETLKEGFSITTPITVPAT